jgi:hypothetical protein
LLYGVGDVAGHERALLALAGVILGFVVLDGRPFPEFNVSILALM